MRFPGFLGYSILWHQKNFRLGHNRVVHDPRPGIKYTPFEIHSHKESNGSHSSKSVEYVMVIAI